MKDSTGKGSLSLNEHQVRRIRITCGYIDRLLTDIENILSDSVSGAAFPRYIPDITPAQQQTIEDSLARLRARLVRILDDQGITRCQPTIPLSRAIICSLGAIDSAVEELKPKYMKGYGDLGEDMATELNGIVGDLHGLTGELNRYLGADTGEDLAARLHRLE
ncbi:MAG: hypothetical protein JXA08_00735 [Methanomicrobiaceae archaeon]|nr:hypothetical protein [Methanomicrobiaceae archaeon]